MTDEEKFFAWLDGELEPDDAARFAARVTTDPTLAQLAREHRTLRRDLERAFDPLIGSPIPARLSEPLLKSGNVIDFAAATRKRSMPPLIQWGAIAASLMVGILVGVGVPRTSSPVKFDAGGLYASASLNRALDTELASAPSGNVRIGITFRDHSGSICRTFTEASATGLACRSNRRWNVTGLFAAPEGQGENYRMASGMNPNLAQMVGSAMAGEPLDAAAERAAKSAGWN